MNQTETHTAIDLFAGCGGVTQGLKNSSYSILGALERDSLAAETYSLNHPEVRVWQKDIREVDETSFRQDLSIERGSLHLLAACPPCQGFSSIRTRNRGKSAPDVRNNLIYDTIRFIKELLPVTLMLENVPGLAKDRRLTQLVTTLERLEYYVDWRILNTADYAVPQRRSRLILIASRLGKPRFAPRAKLTTTVRSAISTLPPPSESTDPLHSHGERRTGRIQKLIQKIPLDGGSRTDLGESNQLSCHQNCDGFYDVYGRMSWDSPAPTLTGGCINPSKGRFLHPDQHRAVTLREAALLQTFPPDYKFSLERGKYKVAEQIGNALPPEFIFRHGRQLARHLRRNLQTK